MILIVFFLPFVLIFFFISITIFNFICFYLDIKDWSLMPFTSETV